MKNIKIDFKHPCIQCGNQTNSYCATCKRSLCGKCRTKKPFLIPLSSYRIPSGICHDCNQLLLSFSVINFDLDFTIFISKLPERIEELKKRYL